MKKGLSHQLPWPILEYPAWKRADWSNYVQSWQKLRVSNQICQPDFYSIHICARLIISQYLNPQKFACFHGSIPINHHFSWPIPMFPCRATRWSAGTQCSAAGGSHARRAGRGPNVRSASLQGGLFGDETGKNGGFNDDLWRFYGDFMVIHGKIMVVLWWFMVIHGGIMVILWTCSWEMLVEPWENGDLWLPFYGNMQS